MLEHYENIVEDRKTAKYLICKRIQCLETENMTESEIWEHHNKISTEFHTHYEKIEIENPHTSKNNFLKMKINLTRSILRNCELCEHRCQVDRVKGEKGFCGVDVVPRISSYFLHMGEEKPLIPSGTIFFSGCTLRCAFNIHNTCVCA
ncbi:MAG: hypothetical protein ACTSQY_09070 [Candidatus Odinarchaeia archaeon]